MVVVQLPWDVIKREVRRAIERQYPKKEGKKYIKVSIIAEEMDENPAKDTLYKQCSQVPITRRKVWIVYVLKKLLKWRQYSRGKHATGSGGVFIRPGCGEE